MKSVAVGWNLDRLSLILIAEDQKGGGKINKGMTKRYLDFSPGFRLQEQYQFRLSRDFFLRNKGKYGTREYVKANTIDTSIRDSVRDVATCFYKLSASKAAGVTSPICADPFPKSAVDAFLSERGL